MSFTFNKKGARSLLLFAFFARVGLGVRYTVRHTIQGALLRVSVRVTVSASLVTNIPNGITVLVLTSFTLHVLSPSIMG